MIRSKRRLLLGGAMAVGVVLALASTAFACTVYYGKLTVGGNGTLNQDKAINGNGSGAFQWCGTVPAYTAADSTKSSFWTTRTNDSSPSLTVATAAATSCGTHKLESGTYSVGISNGFWDESADGFAAGEEDNCHSILPSSTYTGPKGTIIATNFSINSSGVGSATYSGTTPSGATLSNEINLGWNTICVMKDTGQQFAPANALNFKSV